MPGNLARKTCSSPLAADSRRLDNANSGTSGAAIHSDRRIISCSGAEKTNPATARKTRVRSTERANTKLLEKLKRPFNSAHSPRER